MSGPPEILSEEGVRTIAHPHCFEARFFSKGGSIRLSPATSSLAEARKWLTQTATTLDGILAKRRDLDYRPGERDGTQKVKNFRSADCVVGGFRCGKGTRMVGSLLLGLYDAEGLLHHVGFTSSIPSTDRPALTKKLKKLIAPPGFTGSAPGGPSRWHQGRESIWHPLKLQEDKGFRIRLGREVGARASQPSSVPDAKSIAQRQGAHRLEWSSKSARFAAHTSAGRSFIMQ